jgi:hypothetical protein
MHAKRQFLVNDGKPTISEENRVKDIVQLRTLLQSAVQLELTTIPPYLCALYSIKEGTNRASIDVIQSVVMEEMLHMVLAANVLNAIGGKPDVNSKDFVPNYPVELKMLGLTVNLEKFAESSIDLFINIERPDSKPNDQPAPGCQAFDEFHSIGQFYEQIELGLIDLSEEGNIFTGNPDHQIGPEHYYGGGGDLLRVTDLDSARLALKEIIGQGEGIPFSIWESEVANPGRAAYLEMAHFYRFLEIRERRRYNGTEKIVPESKTPPDPKGEVLSVTWNDVYPMRKNPKMADLPHGSEALEKAKAFNRTYMDLLNNLHETMNGKPEQMLKSVGIMYSLKYQAIELMKTPVPGSKETIGPSFEFVES